MEAREDMRCAIVTGGGRGIGRASAEALAAAGIAVAVVARTGDQVAETAAGIERRGGLALPVTADLSRPGAAEEVAAAARECFGGACDILVNAAGIAGPVAELSDVGVADWQRVIDINLTAPFAMCRAVVPGMRSAGWGRVVNISSGYARRVQPGVGPYSASKAGLAHLSRVMDAECRHDGVRVFALEPGVVRTEMNSELRAQGHTRAGARVAEALRDIETGPGLVSAAESARLICLAATGEADDLAGEAVSIYEPAVRARSAVATH